MDHLANHMISHANTIGYASIMLLDFTILLVALRIMTKGPKSGIDADSNKTHQRSLFVAFICAAVFGRVLLAEVPNVQPVTILVLMCGALLGWRRGVGMALIVTLLTNIQLGSGQWSVFQALGWAIVAIVGYRLADHLVSEEGYIRLKPVLLVGFGMAFVFDLVVSLSVLPTLSQSNEFINYLIAGLPYDFLHAFGNITFGLWLVPSVNYLLQRADWQVASPVVGASTVEAA